jgi:MoaA/NifB/PqqE/SkfB family radical SAM enzyme
MMQLTGLHLLLTYQCNFECEHCFVWGSPWQTGTMTLKQIRHIVQQAKELGTVEWFYFEGGEPFLYYPIMLAGIREAAQAGFKTGIVTNSYWASELEDAVEWLRPFAGWIHGLSISSDLYHFSEKQSQQAKHARAAAEELGIALDVIQVAEPEATTVAAAVGQLPPGESGLMCRGRAAQKLVERATCQPWTQFTECPYEDLREAGRVHVDPFGHLHICQGISVGNLFESPLTRICEQYDPDSHPITGPLLAGGPAELVRQYGLAHKEEYADACHLCYEARVALRERFPEVLVPDQMYGVVEG